MASGSCTTLDELPEELRRIFEEGRRGVFTTIDPHGWPHAVPVVYVVRGDEIVTPIDDKPKTGRELKRVRNLRHDPNASLLVDRWDEDWTRLGWVMVRGHARVLDESVGAELLVERYAQYSQIMTPGARSIVLVPERITWWRWTD